jgi:hypothetical protein
MKRPAVQLSILALLTAGLALAGARILTAGGDEARASDERRTIPETGAVVEEHFQGLPAHDTETIDLKHGSVTLPRATGITWGFGHTPCGYGLYVWLPSGMAVCFDEDEAEVEVMSKNTAGEPLAQSILESAPQYRVRPSVITGELP